MQIFSKNILYTLLVSLFCSITVLILYMFFSGHIPALKAAGVNTGAPDVNARYLDGYGTATATSSTKIYISTASGYLPTGSVDTGSLLDGTIVDADMSSSAAIELSKFSGGDIAGFCFFSLTATSCPSGWTLSESHVNRIIRGATSTIGSTGGAATHTHAHGGGSCGGAHSGTACSYSPAFYTATVSSASSWPPYMRVLVCCKD